MRDRSRSPLSNGDEERSRFDKQAWDKKSSKKGIRPPSPPNKKAYVYVTNIPYDSKWQTLKDLFRRELDTVAGVRRIEVLNDETGSPRGCAIVTLQTKDFARKALEIMNHYELKGRKLLVRPHDGPATAEEKRGLPRDTNIRPIRTLDRGRTSLEPPPPSYGETYGLSPTFLQDLNISGPLVKKVFVSNLDFRATDKDLEEVCQVAGKVVNVDLSKDEEGRSRGFAVVEFAHPVQAVQAISMLNNQYYRDRKLNIRMDRVSKEQSGRSSGAQLPKGLKGIGMGLGANGRPMTDLSEIEGQIGYNSSSCSTMPMSNPNSMVPMSSRLDMGIKSIPNMAPEYNMMNMPSQASNYNIPDSYSPMNNMGPMSSVNPMGSMNSMSNMNMSSMNMRSDRFDHPSSMTPMAPMNPVNNMNISSPMGHMNKTPYNQNAMGMPGTSGSRMGYPSRSSMDYSKSRTIVRIGNLPSDYTWQSLRDLCRDYGDIKFAEIRPYGIGLVRFSNEAEAIRAADMLDRQHFDGRFLDARIV